MTTTRFLRKYVFSNWGLKLLSLGISFFLWTTYNAEPLSEVGYTVPLEFVNIPRALEISNDVPTTVRVRVRGRSGLLRRLSAVDLSLRVDLKSAQAGNQEIRLTPDMVGVPYGATVVRLSPSEFAAVLEPHRAPPPAE
ncbi:MAG: YbbR-like domain-containing protein [Candidatus Acidiferrales bacterium]